MADDTELEDMRRRRMQQLQQQLQSQVQEQMQQQLQEEEVARQIKAIVSRIMTPEARQRLANIRLARPMYARQIEILLIQLLQAGKLPQKIDDALLLELLKKIGGSKRETQIKRL